MRSSADRLSQLGVDQFLKGLLHQVTEQEPDLVTAKLRDELSQSGIMALGHRVSPFESTADELAEDSTVAPSDHGSTYTTRWDAYTPWGEELNDLALDVADDAEVLESVAT